MKKKGKTLSEVFEEEAKKERKKLASASIIHETEGIEGNPEHELLCRELLQLVGSKIVDAGFVPEVKEGGLTIDFDKDGKKMRLVVGYNDLGGWVEFFGERK